MMSEMLETTLSGTCSCTLQFSGHPFSYCGHSPWTMNPKRRGPLHSAAPGSDRQNAGDHDKDNK